MSYTTYPPGGPTAHRWSQLAANDLLPAVHDLGKLPRTESLKPLAWTGGTPTLVSGKGVVHRLLGWGGYEATSAQVRDWHDEGHNLLLQTRWLRGLRIERPTMAEARARWSELHAEVEDFLGESFTPPVVSCGPTPECPLSSVTFFVEVENTPWLATVRASGASLLGAGSVAIVSGSTPALRPVTLLDCADSWAPPRISQSYLFSLWQVLSGDRLTAKAVVDASMQHWVLLGDDPLARLLDRNGWVLGTNPRGLTLRCPFYSRGCALYEPTGGIRHKPRISSPYARGKKTADFLRAMELDCALD